MHIVYPADYFKPQLVDDTYRQEAEAVAQKLGSSQVSTWDGQVLRPSPTPGQRLLYRGWMLDQQSYMALYSGWASAGHMLLTSPEHYALCHYLPNWYHSLQAHTPETHFIEKDGLDTFEDTLALLFKGGWKRAFLKDAVKSLKTAGGSFVQTTEEAERWLKEMSTYRSQLEWPLCIREAEDWLPDTERRYFIYKDQILSADPEEAEIPAPVKAAQAAIDSPFFSVDVIQNSDGQWRLVEIGDGQVSDWKTEHGQWSAEGFVNALFDHL